MYLDGKRPTLQSSQSSPSLGDVNAFVYSDGFSGEGSYIHTFKYTYTYICLEACLYCIFS